MSSSKTKVLVRKLPPGLSEEQFVQTVEKLIHGRYDWLSFYAGKARQAHHDSGLSPAELGLCP